MLSEKVNVTVALDQQFSDVLFTYSINIYDMLKEKGGMNSDDIKGIISAMR